MKKLLCLTLCLLLALGAAGCAEKTYAPTGQLSGDEALDGQVLALLEELCSPKETAQENLLHVYDFLCNDITYRPGTVDTSGGFTAELTNRLAAELLSKRKGNCDSIAALTAVLLRRMGYEAQIVQGTFLRGGTDEPVDHAWVYAVVDGTGCCFDPLYGSHFAADARDYCMAGADRMRLTHQWDETLTG